jgi:hypothetical protein
VIAKEIGRYKVVGRRAYRGHDPGEEFEARLDVAADARAIGGGSIQLLERLTADLPADKYRLPQGWPGTERKGGC